MKIQVVIALVLSLIACSASSSLEKRSLNEARSGDYDFFDFFLGLFGLDDSEEDYNFDNQNITITCKNCTVSVNGEQVSGGGMNGMATTTANGQSTTAAPAGEAAPAEPERRKG